MYYYLKLKMVLGFIDFLLGGKKKTKAPQNAQASSTNSGANPADAQNNSGQAQNAQAAGDGENKSNEMQFQDSNGGGDNAQASQAGGDAASTAANPSTPAGGKKSISEVMKKITTEIKEINDTVVNISTEMKEVQNNISSMDHKLSELETANNLKDEKLSEIDENMSKFLSLYEVVNNQYNPFVSGEDMPVQMQPKEIVLDANGDSSSTEENSSEEKIEEVSEGSSIKDKLEQMNGGVTSQTKKLISKDDLDALLELDTIDLDSAAADAVPLTHMKSSTNSLVVILSWLEYLVKKAGIIETKKTLTYYTETLKWITPEVYFELDKFLRGMEDIEGETKERLNVRDHIVSLYFISKLNEKKLDDRLTKAVLQIIKAK